MLFILVDYSAEDSSVCDLVTLYLSFIVYVVLTKQQSAVADYYLHSMV